MILPKEINDAVQTAKLDKWRKHEYFILIKDIDGIGVIPVAGEIRRIKGRVIGVRHDYNRKCFTADDVLTGCAIVSAHRKKDLLEILNKLQMDKINLADTRVVQEKFYEAIEVMKGRK